MTFLILLDVPFIAVKVIIFNYLVIKFFAFAPSGKGSSCATWTLFVNCEDSISVSCDHPLPLHNGRSSLQRVEKEFDEYTR